MARFTPIVVEVGGRNYAGDYEVQGGLVKVGSAYGSADVRIGRADPDKAARAALEDLVQAWLKAGR